jgi:hypothetical protein
LIFHLPDSLSLTPATVALSNMASSLSHGPDQCPWIDIKAPWEAVVKGAIRQNAELEKTWIIP